MSHINPKEGNVFVATYGSLRRMMGNHRCNDRANASLVGLGKTKAPFNLYSMGAFPSISLKHFNENTPVVVEVYEAPKGNPGLEGAYDSLEGYPNFYNRTEVEIQMDTGDTLVAWIYHIDEETGPWVISGDWCLENNPNYYENLSNMGG